jgi:dihydrofolate reductase
MTSSASRLALAWRVSTLCCSAGKRTTSSPRTGQNQEDGADATISRLFNQVPKYVASRSNPTLDWAGSSLLGPDLPDAVRQVRSRHNNVHVIGSLDLTQTLVAERLFDRLNLWLYPIVLGRGKKVFGDGAIPTNLTLAEPPLAGKSGAVLLRYTLADGTPATGDMTRDDRGV